jgi:hypothetical protein
MAMLKKTFLAAVACGSIALAGSAFAQAGGTAGGGAAGASAGGMAGASMGATAGTGMAGTTGTSLGGTSTMTKSPAGTTNTTVNGTLNGNTGLSSTNNTLANNSSTLGTNNRTATNNMLGTNNTTTLGVNGAGTNNILAQNNLGVNAGPGVTNNLGTRGPAGSTSVSSAEAGIRPNSAPSPTTAGGSTNRLDGNAVVEHRQIAHAPNSHAHVAAIEHARHRVAFNHEWRREMGSITRLNAREHNVTARLNRAQLNGVTAFLAPVNGQSVASLNDPERNITAQLNLDQLNRVG